MDDDKKTSPDTGTMFDMNDYDPDFTLPVSVKDREGKVWTFHTRAIEGHMARVMQENPKMDVASIIHEALTEDGFEALQTWMSEAKPPLFLIRKVIGQIWANGQAEPATRRKGERPPRR